MLLRKEKQSIKKEVPAERKKNFPSPRAKNNTKNNEPNACHNYSGPNPYRDFTRGRVEGTREKRIRFEDGLYKVWPKCCPGPKPP